MQSLKTITSIAILLVANTSYATEKSTLFSFFKHTSPSDTVEKTPTTTESSKEKIDTNDANKEDKSATTANSAASSDKTTTDTTKLVDKPAETTSQSTTAATKLTATAPAKNDELAEKTTGKVTTKTDEKKAAADSDKDHADKSDKKLAEKDKESGLDFAVGVKAGNLGFGYEAAKALGPVDLRVGMTKGDISGSLSAAGISYSSSFNADAYQGTLAIHPTNSGFYLAAGGMANNNHVTLKTKATRLHGVKIGETEVTSGTVSAKLTFDDLSPYAGIGYHSQMKKDKGLGFTSELGLLYQGSPHVNLTVSSLDASDPNIRIEEKEMEGDLKSLSYYPVISFGLSYNF